MGHPVLYLCRVDNALLGPGNRNDLLRNKPFSDEQSPIRSDPKAEERNFLFVVDLVGREGGREAGKGRGNFKGSSGAVPLPCLIIRHASGRP